MRVVPSWKRQSSLRWSALLMVHELPRMVTFLPHGLPLWSTHGRNGGGSPCKIVLEKSKNSIFVKKYCFGVIITECALSGTSVRSGAEEWTACSTGSMHRSPWSPPGPGGALDPRESVQKIYIYIYIYIYIHNRYPMFHQNLATRKIRYPICVNFAVHFPIEKSIKIQTLSHAEIIAIPSVTLMNGCSGTCSVRYVAQAAMGFWMPVILRMCPNVMAST